ncbi:hypothetical protein C8R48DRAFT_736716 [Suillus tomentosus]|nr:hypothetical protein C8R48DRAFT_736716 [Suillus tomentosus]
MKHVYRSRRGSSMTKVFHLMRSIILLSTFCGLGTCCAEIGRRRRIGVAVFVEANRAWPKRQGLCMSLSPLLK